MEQRTDYPALLASLSPDQAVGVLTDRVGLIKQVNSNVADWLQERRKVEEAYVIGLRKLASRPQLDGGAALGIFQTPWQRIVSSTENLAASHEILAQKIETDVELPLRTFASQNREMKAVNSSTSNISSVARDLSSAQKKASKGGRKGDEANASVDEASRQWESQAPYVFEQLQALDERRINTLRDVLTQLQTHEVDQVERNRASAESCLNALLSLETSEEIRNFAAKVSGGGAGIARRRSSAAASTTRPTSSMNPPAPPPPRLTQDRATRRQSSQDAVPQLPETPQKSKLGGLRRLGTVMNKRKSMAPPPLPTEKKEKKSSRSLMPFRRGDSSRSFQDLEESGADLNRSRSNDPHISQMESRSSAAAASRERIPQLPPLEESTPMTNGTSNNPFLAQNTSEAAPPPGPPPRQSTGLMEPLTPSQPASATSPSIQQSRQEQFQPPPGPPPQSQSQSQTPSDPMSRAQQEAYATSTTSTDADDQNRNFAIRDKPIQEDESEAQLAMSNMANQLRMQAPVSRTIGSVRGRRDVRNTMFFPAGVDPTSPSLGATSPTLQPAASPAASDLASPIARAPLARQTIHEDHPTGTDSQSIHSSHSLNTLAHHPELTSPGLNASIVETVNTWFTDTAITKSFVTGEIALAYNTTPASPPAENVTIRLTHFELLEKVAANPMFVTSPPKSQAAAEEAAGVYTVVTNSIRRSTPTVGLKYQLHIDKENLGVYSPLLITPAWQVVEGQTSVILLYSLNPAFNTQSSSESANEMVMKNVLITIALAPDSPTKPASAMMSPTQNATFKKRTGAVTWKIPELIVKSTQERMLVRFMTPGGTAKRGGVEVRFEVGGRGGSVVGVERKVLGGSVEGKKRESGEGDPFADEAEGRVSGEVGGAGEGWEGVECKRCLVSGRYSAS